MCAVVINDQDAHPVLIIPKQQMIRLLHEQPELSDRLITHLLARNIRIQEDVVDQLFNSSDKRLARALLLLAHYGKPGRTHRVLPRRLTVALAHSLVVAAFFAVPSFADDEEALKKDVVPLPMRAGRVSQGISVRLLT